MPPALNMAQTMGPSGPASPPTSNPGLAADSLSKLREAVRLIEQSLPGLDVGTKPHKAAISAMRTLSEAVPASEEVPGVQQTQLMGLQQAAQKSAMLQALMRSMGSGQQADPSQMGQSPQPQAA